MAFDPYEPCPCGSGKKLKFCCQSIAPEMERIGSGKTKNQPRMVQRNLEKLLAEHPGNPWITINLSLLLLEDGELVAVQKLLTEFLQAHPDHGLATALLAIASFGQEGYSASKRVISRAFQRCHQQHPRWIARLALGISSLMFSNAEFMAARQFLALALRLSVDQEQQECFVGLLELESNRDIPYPLRGVHHLLPVGDLEEEDGKEALRGRRLVDIGCFAAAAVVFSRLADKHPQDGGLRANAGLCYVWDGESRAGSTQLHQAARLLSDRNRALECEVIAQLFEHEHEPVVVSLDSRCYEVQSLAQLIGRLSDAPQLRSSSEPRLLSVPNTAHAFEVLDAVPSETADDGKLQRDQVGFVQAEVVCFDADKDRERPALAVLYAFPSADLNVVAETFEKHAGDLVQTVELPAEDEQELELEEFINRFDYGLMRPWEGPANCPVSEIRRFQRELWTHSVSEVWLDFALPGFDGKTPRECIGQPEYEIPLAASAFVLDSYADRHDRDFDPNAFCEQTLQVAPLQTVPATDASISACTALELTHLEVESLSDEQLTETVQRALLMYHRGFLYRVLREVLKRPHCRGNIEMSRILTTMASLYRDRGELDEAFHCLELGVEDARQQENPAAEKASWLFREAVMRLERPHDEKLPSLLSELWETYGPLFPSLRERLMSVVAAFDYDPPWEQRRVITADSGTAAASEVWTPDSAPEAGGSGSKLWLPGQD